MYIIPLALLTLVGGALVQGLVLRALWIWFLLPMGVPSIGVAQALGIALLVSMLTHQSRPKNQYDEKQGTTEVLAEVFVGPLVTLALGWIVHLCM